MKHKQGITLISTLVALFILLTGIVTLLRVFPVIEKLSGKAKRAVSASFIADKIFVSIEESYGSIASAPVPRELSGIDSEYPQYSYRTVFKEEKENFYKVELEISGKKEGKIEKQYFYDFFRRK